MTGVARRIGAVAGHTLREGSAGGLRWFAPLAAAGGLALAGVGSVLAGAPPSDPVPITVLAFALRLFAVLFVAVLVVTSVGRELENRALALVLATALPRPAWVAGRLAGLIACATGAALVCAGVLMFHAPLGASLAWGLSLALELAIVAAFGMFCALTITHAPSALCALLAFCMAGRAVGALAPMFARQVAQGEDGALAALVLETAVALLALALPDLSRHAPAAWPAHDAADWAELGFVALRSAGWLVVFGAATMFDLERKSF